VIDRDQVHQGMLVRGSNGKKLGRVVRCTEGGFVVEKGFLWATDYAARYGDVAEVSAETIQLSRPRPEFAYSERQPSMGERGVVWPSYGDEGGGGLL
jgi:hypothetical protein